MAGVMQGAAGWGGGLALSVIAGRGGAARVAALLGLAENSRVGPRGHEREGLSDEASIWYLG